jgi:hypothetical protein
MKTRLLFLAALAFVATVFLTQSCEKTTEPELEPERLSGFSLDLPDTVMAGDTFKMTVTAVGEDGTKPLSRFSGYVVLTASDGTITPDSLLLGGGIGSGLFVLSITGDSQTITATSGAAEGSAIVNARFMARLRGNDQDSANEAIPSFHYFARASDYSTGHPSLPGMAVSHNTIVLAFELGTTIGRANTLLGGVGAEIVGGITGDDGVAPGVLFLRLPTSSHAQLQTALATLRADAAVNTAIEDVLMIPDALPAPNDGDPATWTWGSTPAGANWGLERIRVPQMWNANGAISKKNGNDQMPPSTVLIVDEGFDYIHPDMSGLFFRPIVEDPHGTHVAGIIGATYDNGKGIDGVCPNVFMIGNSVALHGSPNPYRGRVSAGQATISALHHGMRPYVDVVNMSIGYNWADAGIDSDTDVYAQNIVAKQARLLVNAMHLGTLSIRSPLIVVSAGNDSGRGFGDQDARYNSPMCYAAIEMGVQNIVVVEGVMDSPGTGDGDVTRFPSSSIGGNISAPGSDVWGTTSDPSLYRGGDGTSYAAAIVTGIAANLYLSEPYLTYMDVTDVLYSNALSAGDGAAPRVDAWASFLDLDRVRGGTEFLRMMCDIDDGTADGNQRVECGGHPFFEEDADQDGGVGDGNVDMSDFRRWRDWLILIHPGGLYHLDGGPNHPKNDVNHNGVVEDAAGENVHPRGDFNGDGVLHELTTSFVPGAVGAQATDLEVFQTVFSDPDYNAADLFELINSADYQVDASVLLETSTNVSARLLRLPDQALAASHTFTSDEPAYVFTMLHNPGGYRVEVLADGEEFEHGDRNYNLGTGEDAIFQPIKYVQLDPRGTYLHTCNDAAKTATPINLAALGIYPGDVICLDNEGSFAYTEDPGWVSYECIAVFSSSSSISGGSSSHRIPGAINAGEDFETWATNDCEGEPTDIAEDFLVTGDGVIIKVPDGARYLFMCGLDSKYADNWAPSGRFGVQLSIVTVPDEYIY